MTGGTGFLGRHLVEALLAQGARDVRVLAQSPPSWLAGRGVEVVEGSVLSEDAVAQAVAGREVVCHLAGRVSRNPDDKRELFAVHLDGTRILCEAARAAGVRRILLASSSGTIAVTEDGKRIPDETHPPPVHLIARWPYYASKLYQEQVAARACAGGPELVVLHPSLLLGSGDSRLSSTADVLKFLSREIPAIPPGGLNFVDVRDAALAFVAAIRKAQPGERYLLGGPNWSFEKFFGRLERLSGVPGPRLRAPGKAIEWGGLAIDALYRHWGRTPPVDRISLEMSCHFWYLDSSKARRELGFTTRDPGDTLQETVAYLREHVLGERIGSAH